MSISGYIRVLYLCSPIQYKKRWRDFNNSISSIRCMKQLGGKTKRWRKITCEIRVLSRKWVKQDMGGIKETKPWWNVEKLKAPQKNAAKTLKYLIEIHHYLKQYFFKRTCWKYFAIKVLVTPQWFQKNTPAAAIFSALFESFTVRIFVGVPIEAFLLNFFLSYIFCLVFHVRPREPCFSSVRCWVYI